MIPPTNPIVTPKTMVETEEGKQAPAKRVKGLTFADALPIEEAVNFFYTDANGQKQQIDYQHLRLLVAQRVIMPDTLLETEKGHKGLAGQIPDLFCTIPANENCGSAQNKGTVFSETVPPQPSEPIPPEEYSPFTLADIPPELAAFTTEEQTEIDEFCKNYGNDVKPINGDDWTLLHRASVLGNTAVAKYLISMGAEINVKNNFGYTPLDLAYETKKEAMVQYLSSVGAKRSWNRICWTTFDRMAAIFEKWMPKQEYGIGTKTGQQHRQTKILTADQINTIKTLNTYFDKFSDHTAGGMARFVIGFVLLLIGAGCEWWSFIFWSTVFLVWCSINLIVGLVYEMMLLYQFWIIIPSDIARTTPSKAVGYSFIPYFNIYWFFVAYMGLGEDMNKTLREQKVQYQIEEHLGMILCICWAVGITLPFLVLPEIVGLIITIIFFKSVKNGAIAIIEQGNSTTAMPELGDNTTPLPF